MDPNSPNLLETAGTIAYVFRLDWRAGIVTLLRVAMAAEAISPGCLTGRAPIRH